jgi:hypothetical protein
MTHPPAPPKFSGPKGRGVQQKHIVRKPALKDAGFFFTCLVLKKVDYKINRYGREKDCDQISEAPEKVQ